MSIFIWGKIVTSNRSLFMNEEKISFDITELCIKNGFSIDFRNKIGIPKMKIDNHKDILFSLSDNFFISHCNHFMEPIYYPENGEPTYIKLKIDLLKIKNLFTRIFEYSIVNSLELYISDGESNIEDYDVYYTNLQNFENIVCSCYIESKWIPTVNIVIFRQGI